MDLDLHRALELLIGSSLAIAAFVISAVTTDIDGGGVVVCVAAGALLVGIAVDAGADGQLHVMRHATADRLMAVALLAASLVLLLTGEQLAALLCLVAAVGEVGLLTTTRYVTPRSHPSRGSSAGPSRSGGR
jgi:glucose uptake protein GlcU